MSALLLISVVVTVAQTSEQERAFLTKVEEAIRSKEATNFLALYCWDRVDEKFRAAMKEHAEEKVSHKLAKAELLEITDDDLFGGYTEGGITYKPNLKPIRKLSLTYAEAEDSDLVGSELLVGLKEGQLMLVAAAPSTNAPVIKSEAMKDWEQAAKLMIQTKQGTLTLPVLEMAARKYLDDRDIVVLDGEPIIAIIVCDTNRMARVQFLESTNSIRTVEIGSDGKAVKDYEIKLGY
ncbi:MAG TPA: hypothetical protein PKA41_06040 [Verrucomicrobiota bacterium]|nr:hypothetical protein [Verrucomicrobiota bacterium]